MTAAYNTATLGEILFPATQIGGTGVQTKVIFTGPTVWVKLLSLVLTYVATATTGGITAPTLQAVDAAGNVLWEIPFTAVAAGATAVLEAAAGVPLSTGTATLQFGPIPEDFWLPPAAKLQLTGTVAAATDTVQATGVSVSR